MSTRSSNSRTTTYRKKQVHSKYVQDSASSSSDTASTSSTPRSSTSSRPSYQNKKVGYNRVISALRQSFASLPEGADVVDVHGNLAKIHVPYDDNSAHAHLWRGAIVDYNKKKVIKEGYRNETVHVPDSEDLSTLPAANPESKSFYFSPVFDGALVSVFKYEDTIYYSTGRYLGVNNTRTHPGALDITSELKKLLPEGLLDELFDEDSETVVYYYDFILLHEDTLDSSHADVALPAVVHAGRNTLLNTSGSARAVEIRSGMDLGETDLYPTKPGFYNSVPRIPMGVAQNYLSGRTTGAGEALLVIETDPIKKRTSRITRIESEAYTARHNIRGNVARVLHRLSEFMADYYVDEENKLLVPTENKKGAKAIYYGASHTEDDELFHIARTVLIEALPQARTGEVDEAIRRVHLLIDKLTHFFRSNDPNKRHPAYAYYKLGHGAKSRSEREKIVYSMDLDTLMRSVRWYHLLDAVLEERRR